MAYPLTVTEFEIPQRSGAVLCLPHPREFAAIARANADALAGARLQIGGLALPELRRRARARVSQEAGEFTRAMGIQPAQVAPDALWLVTGHQPFLFHPGIWIKHLLVDRMAADGVAALSIPVDCDALEDVGADVPTMEQGLRLMHETLTRAPADVAYEAQPAPSPAQWREFLDRLAAHLRTVGAPEISRAFEAFVKAAGTIDGAADIGSFLTIARRRHEGYRRYLELPASRLGLTNEFAAFFVHILRDCERFSDAYNRHLDAYREQRNIRTAAQPFPNLERDGRRIELPFWTVQAGRRLTLFAERAAGAWRLWAEGTVVGTVDDGDGIADLRRLAVRPKALTLTAFMRLCLADLFVHGVGGGRYDRVTDAVITDYFGIVPPQYAVVTATLHLPLGAFNLAEERKRLQRRLLELQHNPERLLAGPSEPQQALIDEKWRLIRALDGAGLTRRERRGATQRIREINEALSTSLESERAHTQRSLESLADAGDAADAATHRGYPFCFFFPQDVDALIQATLDHGPGA